MIPVNEVFDTCSQLLRQDANGYFSAEDFNRVQQLAQNTLMNYYLLRHQSGLKVTDSIDVFVKSTPVLYVPPNGAIALPVDYKHRLEMMVAKTPGMNWQPCRLLKHKEISGTASSTVRRPSQDSVFYDIYDGSLHIMPPGGGLVFKMKYIRKPASAVYSVIIDPVNVVENFNPAGSIDFEWPEHDRRNLVDLIMYHMGVQTRASEIIDYLASDTKISDK